MPKSKLANKKTSASTQQYLDIAEIRDDLVVMKDGGLRAILLVSSINFALKSEDEQNALIQGYMSFLNSLDFELQIVIQSRRLNIDQYLAGLAGKEKEQTNELLRTQIREYRDFIGQLVMLGEIMGKRFYVAVPYNSDASRSKSFVSQLGSVFSPSRVIRLSDKLYDRYRGQLASRIEKVASGLGSMGLSAVQLNTQSLIELYYTSYNLDLSYSQNVPEQKDMKVEE